jgi:hypothetical protein
MTARLEPRPQKGGVSRPADAVSAFDDDQFAGINFFFDAG